MSPLIGWALAMAQGLTTTAPAAPPVVARLASAALAALAAAVGGVAALACGLASLWIYAVPHVGPAGAPLIVAAVLVALTLVAVAIARHAMHTTPSPPVTTTPAFPLADALLLVKHHKVGALLAAAFAGLAAGTAKK